MGDALICNGLVRTLIDRGHQLIIPCWTRNEPSVKAMFHDLIENGSVEVIGSLDPDLTFANWEPQIKLGQYGVDFDPKRWDESFYRQANVPFSRKWDAFSLGRGYDRISIPPEITHRFVHDDEDRGFNIPLEGTRPTKNCPILFWAIQLPCFAEIHCINSCFAILADLIDAPGQKFLHRYARPDGGALPVFGREWTILDAPL